MEILVNGKLRSGIHNTVYENNQTMQHFSTVGGQYDDTLTDLQENQTGSLRMTPPRGLHTNLRDSTGNEITLSHDAVDAGGNVKIGGKASTTEPTAVANGDRVDAYFGPRGHQFVSPTEFYTEVQKGNVPGHSLVHKYGRNDAVPNAAWEHVSLLSGATSFRSSAITMRIKAGGNAADTAAGAGAQEVTITGMDSNLAEVSEAIVTNGAGASTATSATFWRVYRAWVSAVGTYGVANTAAITIEDSGGAADMIMIAAGEGQTQYAGYAVPTGKTAYLLSAFMTVDAAKAADLKMMTRLALNDTAAPMSSARLRLHFDGVLGSLAYKPVSPGGGIAGPADIWWEAYGAGAGTEVSVDFELLLVDD